MLIFKNVFLKNDTIQSQEQSNNYFICAKSVIISPSQLLPSASPPPMGVTPISAAPLVVSICPCPCVCPSIPSAILLSSGFVDPGVFGAEAFSICWGLTFVLICTDLIFFSSFFKAFFTKLCCYTAVVSLNESDSTYTTYLYPSLLTDKYISDLHWRPGRKLQSFWFCWQSERQGRVSASFWVSRKERRVWRGWKVWWGCSASRILAMDYYKF